MADSFAKSMFPKQYAQIEKKRQTATSKPLTSREVNTLLSMRFNGEPMYQSIQEFYSEEYVAALKSSVPVVELESKEHYRPATEREANLLYCDLHAREQKVEYSGGAPSE